MEDGGRCRDGGTKTGSKSGDGLDRLTTADPIGWRNGHGERDPGIQE